MTVEGGLLGNKKGTSWRGISGGNEYKYDQSTLYTFMKNVIMKLFV
jgi:hypothetical protein